MRKHPSNQSRRNGDHIAHLLESLDMARPWSCWHCGALLGVIDRTGVQFKHKAAEYHVSGKDIVVSTTCRRCGKQNELR